jgi:PAS domain S-box-containing protein
MWWQRQSPSRQDRFATLGPLLSVLLFLAAMVSAFWYLRNEENERALESVRRDADIVQQQIRLQLLESQEQLARIARELVTRPQTVSRNAFASQAENFAKDRPELVSLQWVDAKQNILESYTPVQQRHDERGGRDSMLEATTTPMSKPSMPTDEWSEPQQTFRAARADMTPTYSKPYADAFGMILVQVQMPLADRNTFIGVLIADYSVVSLLRHYVPGEVEQRHPISIVDAKGRILATTRLPAAVDSRLPTMLTHDVPMSPVQGDVVVRSAGYRSTVSLVGSTLFWMVLGLSALTVWMLIGTWRHMRRRLQAQTALSAETHFRRAMENSMLTGMRAMDLDSRITYVNPAFCAMTGFNDSELIGVLPPYPHWPPDRQEENMRLLQLELQGRTPSGGIEVVVMRKDGSRFDARMYVSPLIDAKGQQTGWMTSMTNITESKRVRDQLSASHERFTTVLEGLEASVSVVSVDHSELVFANRVYRLWFGSNEQGHTLLAGSTAPVPALEAQESADSVDTLGGLPTHEITNASADMREVHAESLQKWFDVRSRYLQWTDGSLAQMVIATDITAKRQAEELARHQAEKAQVTSRLMTMGEMASSVAHELNQPLTAIVNYCNGMVSRVRARAIDEEALIAALEKTAKQAQRAGQIIHRIRNFVKRSEPQRQQASAQQIVDDATELANIEMRRRNVSIHTYLAQDLPLLMVDPILIEQVLVNLLKNAAEAIDQAKMPSTRRAIDLRLIPKYTPEDKHFVECTVTDTGPGLPKEVIDRLYEAFFSTKVDGLGIGLSLCRSIIESHRGRIKAENLYNGSEVIGCRFTFTIPVSETENT